MRREQWRRSRAGAPAWSDEAGMSACPIVPFFLGLACQLAGAGCGDRAYRVSQVVELAVVETRSGASATQAAVSVAPQASWRDCPAPRLSVDAYLDAYGTQASVPSAPAPVILDLGAWTICDSTIGDRTHDPTHDRLTGATYLVRVVGKQAREIHTVTMRSGVVSPGEAFTVTVGIIGGPRLVPGRRGEFARPGQPRKRERGHQ